MKEKLAPIHFIQHQRIHLQEQLESYLAGKFGMEKKLNDLENHHGTPSTDVMLSDQIDHDNIHGWLEGHLIANEKRLSELLAEIMNDTNLSALHEAYNGFGHNLGATLKPSVSVQNGEELYQLLQSVLLDGMPCDKVNKLVDASEHHLVFSSLKDLHAPYYENAGLSPALYHELRKSFLDGFLKELNLGTYSYSLEEGAIIHKVVLS
ncbi:hypothetical protein [Proteiniclasticum ruminis]|uniref:Uncharacterized protein n=1 Tax=Proteiniclasticum ruminis TaxID=398199 RepID=A0A1I4YRB7_9CLOT|nr:hypothetical protein [Proteiniclasticum ruminis]SFN40588.1 hypothetical protein SAMN04488695_101753 [Proteiniclasticum ruminis]